MLDLKEAKGVGGEGTRKIERFREKTGRIREFWRKVESF
jgi:hypothetical protein